MDQSFLNERPPLRNAPDTPCAAAAGAITTAEAKDGATPVPSIDTNTMCSAAFGPYFFFRDSPWPRIHQRPSTPTYPSIIHT